MPNIPFPRDIPFSVQDFKNEFERWVDRVWHGALSTAPLDGQDWAPSIDVTEESDRFRVRVETPGLSAGDVDVSVLEGTLIIKGVKPPDAARSGDVRTLRAECRYGSFCRRYEFPSPVQEDSIKAACRAGVLTIEVPKTPEARGRSVKVENAD